MRKINFFHFYEYFEDEQVTLLFAVLMRESQKSRNFARKYFGNPFKAFRIEFFSQ